MDRTNKPLKLGFERDLVEVSLDLLLGSKPQPATLKQSIKYSQIRASIKAIGIVEPLAVIPHPAHQGSYMVLDGHLRLEALKELQSESALCLISKDDEAYTYNKRVNRLSAIQEHRMIVRAVDRGVSPETLANALDISKAAIIARFKLLDGICDEAIRLLADKPASRSMFNVLRQMKPLRQIDVSKSMIDLNNYSVKMAMAMLQATAPEQLLDEVRIKTQQSSSSDTLNRLRRELAAVQADTKLLEERYGPDNLQLVIIKTYIKTLLENAKVVRWLARTHGEYLHQLQLIADLENLAT